MTDVDTSGEAVGRSITNLMGWLTGPDSGQNDGLITAANQLAALVAERARMRAALLSDDDIEALQLTRTAASLALNYDLVHQSLRARASDAIARTTAIIARAALNGGTHG